MTETIGIKLNTISEAVKDIMCEAHNESLDKVLNKVEERMELIDRLLTNGEAIIETIPYNRWRKVYAKRHDLYMKMWELYWVMQTLREIRFM